MVVARFVFAESSIGFIFFVNCYLYTFFLSLNCAQVAASLNPIIGSELLLLNIEVTHGLRN